MSFLLLWLGYSSLWFVIVAARIMIKGGTSSLLPMLVYIVIWMGLPSAIAHYILVPIFIGV